MAFKTKIDLADKYFALWIKHRDNFTCQRCGRKFDSSRAQGLDCSHFKTRRRENIRYEPLNCDAICTGCHAYFHQNPEEHRAWQVLKKGQVVVDKLDYAAHQYKKRDRLLEKIYWQQRLLDDFNVRV